MNNFHKIIEAYEKKKLYVADAIDEHDAKILSELFASKYSETICFDIGDIENWVDFRYDYDAVNLPYPVTWFESHYTKNNKREYVGSLCWQEIINGEKIICFLCILKQPETEWMILGLLQYFEDRRKEIIPADHSVASRLETFSSLVFVFLTALHCNNVRALENKPIQKIQEKRRKNGKKPLFSYWTLHLNLPNNTSDIPKGSGNHSSPRLHLRRGHPRQYVPGKWTWVSSCVVGNKKSGMIHKDYSVKHPGNE